MSAALDRNARELRDAALDIAVALLDRARAVLDGEAAAAAAAGHGQTAAGLLAEEIELGLTSIKTLREACR